MIYEKAAAAAEREMHATGTPTAIIQSGRANNYQIMNAAEAIEKQTYIWDVFYPLITCSECERIHKPGAGRQVSMEIVDRKLCFECLQWIWLVDSTDHPNNVRVRGEHYTICLEDIGNCKRGMNGDRYNIKFDDGRLATTTNLWSQGTIPERFRERLPDNAVFISTAEYEAAVLAQGRQ
jgi:hypothetical protein